MCDGYCRCCCGKRPDEAGDGIGGLLVVLLTSLGLTACVAYWLGLMVADWLSAAASFFTAYQTEILCVSLGAILVDLCLVTTRVAGHVAKLPLLQLPAAVGSTLALGAPRLFGRATFRQVANSLGRRGLRTLKAMGRLGEGERLTAASKAASLRSASPGSSSGARKLRRR